VDVCVSSLRILVLGTMMQQAFLYFQNKSSVTRMKDSIIRAAVSKLKLFPPPVTKFEWPKYGISSESNRQEYSTEHKQNIITENTKHSSSVRPEDDRHAQEEVRRQKKRAVEQMQRTAARNIRAVMGETELQGKHRFVAEGFASDSECSKLMELAQVMLPCIPLCNSCLTYIIHLFILYILSICLWLIATTRYTISPQMCIRAQ
jgi:hypothetical protein